jgi:hypothetical protein
MTVSIRVNLEGKIAENFKFLKERRGLKNNSELIRLLVTEAAQRLRGQPAT